MDVVHWTALVRTSKLYIALNRMAASAAVQRQRTQQLSLGLHQLPCT